jgi:hypothetical protein
MTSAGPEHEVMDELLKKLEEGSCGQVSGSVMPACPGTGEIQIFNAAISGAINPVFTN